MDVLFVISVVCFFALFVTSLAIVRHVRIGAPHRDAHDRPLSDGQRRRAQIEALPARMEQNLQYLTHHKEPDWRFLVSGERHTPGAHYTISPMLRKPPATVRDPRRRRPDRAYFTGDPGHLSDPYQSPTTKAAWTDSNERKSSFRHERTS